MGLISMIFGEREEKYIGLQLPVNLLNATDTLIFMLNQDRSYDDCITRDDIIIEALGDHVKKNLFASRKKDNNRTEIQRIDSFKGRGQAQMKG